MEDKDIHHELFNWLMENHGINFQDNNYQINYRYIIQIAKSSLVNSEFWKEVDLLLKNSCISENIPISTNNNLFDNLDIKSLSSVQNKLYRKNILENPNFPNAPEGGWILPKNTFSTLEDLIRTKVIFKYFDGPKLASLEITEIAKKHNLECNVKAHGRDRGYYAYHLYISIPTNKPESENNDYWDFPDKIKFEIQLTTIMQDILYELTHKVYEKIRLDPNMKNDETWKWNNDSFRFKLGYMSHTIHMLEGIIVELRDKEENHD